MKELVLGKITNKELADWFGIKESTFKSSKKKKLEELKDFAEYYEEKGKVIVTKIKMPVYEKLGSKAKQLIKNKVDEIWDSSGLDTCSRVGLRIERELKNELTVATGTIYNYTIEGRNALYGKPFQQGGSLGNCKYLWCKKIGDGIDAQLALLTPEEEEIKQTIIKKYFGNATEKQIIVKGMVECGEITKEEAWTILEELTHMNGGNFLTFLHELEEKLGCQIIKGTLVEKIPIDEETEIWQ